MLALTLLVSATGRAAERPLLVGGHAHGSENIQALADLGLGNFVWIPKFNQGMGNTSWDSTPEAPHGIYADVDACVANGLYFAVSQRRGLGEIWRPGGGHYGGDCWGGDIYDAETIRGIQQRGGELFAGLHAEELDADFIQSGLRPSFRSRIPHLYTFTDRAGGRTAFESELARIRDKYHGYTSRIEYWPNLCVSFHLSGFRIGADLVFAELLESLPTTELQLAYLRGGAQQFGSDWGVWVSPWYRGQVPCEDKDLWPAKPAAPGGGHRPSAFRRCLYLSYASGARVLTMQDTEPLFSRKDPADPQAGYALAPWGEELKTFWDYVKNHPERIEPIVPLAVMVDKDNGWAPGNLHGGWIDKEYVWAKLPTAWSDNMLSSFLDVLLPGYGRKSPGWWDEPGKLYPGYFASTPIGAFDIVASDAQAERLAKYPNVLLLGDIEMTEKVQANLRTYVKQGGNLFVNVYQMRCREAYVQDVELLGATVGMSVLASPGWAGGDIIGRRLISANAIHPRIALPGIRGETYQEPWFAMQDVQPISAEIMAADGESNPVLLRNRYGDGCAYLSTPEYMLQGWENQEQVLSYFADLIRGLVHAGPVTVNAPGMDTLQDGISWVASRRGDETVLIVLANHENTGKSVDIHWRGSCESAAIEAGGGKLESTHTEKEGALFRVTIPSEDVAVLAARVGK